MNVAYTTMVQETAMLDCSLVGNNNVTNYTNSSTVTLLLHRWNLKEANVKLIVFNLQISKRRHISTL